MELLEVESLGLARLRKRRGWFRHAGDRRVLVEALDFAMEKGECFAVLSECRDLLRDLALAVLAGGPVEAGAVRFCGVDLAGLDERRFRPLRGRLQGLFPDSFGQLPPSLTVREAFLEILAVWRRGADREEQERLVETAMIACGLPEAVRDLYPAELDALERQLVALARSLLPGPDLLVCLGPTEGLDVVQSCELVQRLRRAREDYRLALLVLTDNLALAGSLAERAAVVHRGQVVEAGELGPILARPAHDHTRRLVAHAA
jgi:ABC-type microcin C transport system duplicated ATPase subunit YejF